MNTKCRLSNRLPGRALCLSLVLTCFWLSAGESNVIPRGGEPERKWEKFTSEDEWLRDPLALPTPAAFDPQWARRIELEDNGASVDLKFPRQGVDENGAARPPVTATLRGNSIWVDADGDGKAGPDEVRQLTRDGVAGPFRCQTHFDDGTSTPYGFYLVRAGVREPGGAANRAQKPLHVFRVIRAGYRQITFRGRKIYFFDDDGNGRFDDQGRDAVVVLGEPPSLLGKLILVDSAFYEILIYPAGRIVELRPAANLELGRVELTRAFVPPQRSIPISMTTIILKGREGYFSFGDGAFGGRSLPAGAYDFTVGLLQNQKRELWLVKPGERSSFTLPANEMVIPPWGAPLKAVMDLNSTGREVVVSPPRYFGVAEEEYVPLSRNVFLERVYAYRIRKDGRTPQLNLEVKLPLGSPKTFPILDDGSLTPISFEVNSTEMLEFTLENKSGLMGVIRNSERISFVHRRIP